MCAAEFIFGVFDGNDRAFGFYGEIALRLGECEESDQGERGEGCFHSLYIGRGLKNLSFFCWLGKIFSELIILIVPDIN